MCCVEGKISWRLAPICEQDLQLQHRLTYRGPSFVKPCMIGYPPVSFKKLVQQHVQRTGMSQQQNTSQEEVYHIFFRYGPFCKDNVVYQSNSIASEIHRVNSLSGDEYSLLRIISMH